MNQDIMKSLLSQIAESVDGKVDIRVLREVSRIAKRIETKVQDFLVNNNMVKDLNFKTDAVNASNESYNVDGLGGNTLGVDKISDLVDAAGIPACYKRPAMESLGIILSQHLGNNTSTAWGMHNQRSENLQNNIVARPLSTLFPEFIANEFNQLAPSTEAFGVNIDSAVPDMKMAITISLLRFRTNLVPRMMPVRGISQPNVQYIKENLELYPINSVDTPVKRVIDLYADPSMALNELKTIIPLVAVDAVGLVADGLIKFNKTVNIMKATIDITKVGYASLNRTDTVADSVKIASVQVTIGGSSVASTTFTIAIPSTDGRLTRPTNALDSAIRNADIKYIAYLTKGAKNSAGNVAAILGTDLAPVCAADEGIAVSLTLKPSINLKNGVVDALGSVSIAAHHLVDDARLSDDVKALAAAINASGTGVLTLDGYTLDAKFSEENLRKSDIAVRSQRQPFSYDIPTGRNYSYDYAIGQNNAEDSANQLTKIIRIGQDAKVLDLTRETLNNVYDLVQLFTQNPLDPNRDPGMNYVAGSKVRPYVFSGTMDFSDIVSIRDADRTGDIKARARVYLNAVTSELMQKTFFQYELAGDTTATFKLITSPTVLGNIIGQPHIHTQMDQKDERGSIDGVEYVLILDNGIRLECITTTFDSMVTNIIMIPCIKGSVESELNFAHNWDYGTMVGHYTPSGDGAHHRLFANIRELPVPTNPIGALITVKGIEKVTFVATN